MRKVVAIMSLLTFMGFGSAAAQQSEQPKTGQMCLLNVTGMHCGECAKTVEKAAKKIDGVIAAKVSQPNASAEITYDATKTSPDAIAKAITKNTPFRAESRKQDEQQK
jgi:P-type Cu+ transporter